MTFQLSAFINYPHVRIFGTIHGSPRKALLVGLDPVFYVTNAHWQRSGINPFIHTSPRG